MELNKDDCLLMCLSSEEVNETPMKLYKKVNCILCNKELGTTKASYNKYIKSVKKKERKFICNECANKTFNEKEDEIVLPDTPEEVSELVVALIKGSKKKGKKNGLFKNKTGS